jgi:cytoskeleton protein RodZ
MDVPRQRRVGPAKGGRAGAWAAEPVLPIGATLRSARRDAGLTPYDVADATAIRPALVLRLEEDDFSWCGGHTYARGRVRACAEAVGVDPDPLLAAYDRQVAAGAARPDFAARILQRRRRPPRNWSMILAAGLLVAALYAVALLVAALLG